MAGKCMSREENINNITQCMIQNIYETINSLISKKHKHQTNEQTTQIQVIFKDFVQNKIFTFISNIQNANFKKNVL